MVCLLNEVQNMQNMTLKSNVENVTFYHLHFVEYNFRYSFCFKSVFIAS